MQTIFLIEEKNELEVLLLTNLKLIGMMVTNNFVH